MYALTIVCSEEDVYGKAAPWLLHTAVLTMGYPSARQVSWILPAEELTALVTMGITIRSGGLFGEKGGGEGEVRMMKKVREGGGVVGLVHGGWAWFV